MSEALEYGMVGVNHRPAGQRAGAVGGVNESGLGREGAHQGINEYLEVKYINLGDVPK